MTKRISPRRRILPVLIAGSLAIVLHSPGRALATIQQFTETQVEESGNRAEVLGESLTWPPARIGEAVRQSFHRDGAQEALESYQSIRQDLILKLPVRFDQNVFIGDQLMASASDLWTLWQAENRLRWIYLTNTGIGVYVQGVGMLTTGWIAIRLLRTKRGDDRPLDDPTRVHVIPNQPLEFRAPFSEPKGTRLYEIVEQMEFLSPLTERITACFAAMPDHPASIQDHLNVPGGLIEHTARTIEAMVDLTGSRPGEEGKLLILMALCHDLGKLFAYEKGNAGWNDRRLAHDRLSALIVAGLPELYTELPAAQRDTLISALRYYHNSEELPTTAPPNCYTVMEMMHKADAIAYEQEKKLGQEQVEGLKPHLTKALSTALSRLNINRYQGGYPDGFTAGEVIFVLEHALRERTLEQLPQEFRQKLPIRRPSGRLHPAWPLLVEVMKEQDLLIGEVHGRRANPSGLFNITATGVTYKCVVALSMKAVAIAVPEAVALWIQCPPYEVKIAGGRIAG